jgi:glycosyltransferase A (GT-A) superfamily protein (DUF2064 family)
MVADIIGNVTASALPLYLFHDGRDAVGLPEEWVTAAEDVIMQEGDALGERMTAAFECLFAVGRQRVILIGSDIPGIDAELLQSASAAIKEFDVVFSPAFDGGYCLVAAHKDGFNAAMFRNIPWSTSRVLGATLDICGSDYVTYTLLDPRQDIDTVDDIRAYCRHPSTHAASTNSWLASHGYMELPGNG